MEVPGRKGFEKKLLKVGSSPSVLLCQPCQGEDVNEPSEGYCENCSIFLCSPCIKAHRKLPITATHVIKSKDEMPRVQLTSDPCLELCVIHKTKIVKFFCQGHNEVGCGDCMIVHHKTCKAELVTGVSTDFGKSGELQQVKCHLESIVKQLKSKVQDIKSNLEEAVDRNLKLVEEIKKFKRDVNAYLDNAESELLKEVEVLQKKDVKLQNKLQQECESLKIEMEHLRKIPAK